MTAELDEVGLRDALRSLADHLTEDLHGPDLSASRPAEPLATVAPRRWRGAWLAAAASLIILAGVVAVLAANGRSSAPVGPLSPDPAPTPSTATPGLRRYQIDATVLAEAGKAPQLCIGPILQSRPPQCGGPAIAGWDWAAVTDARTEGTTTWGSYHLVGTYDGTTFSLTERPTAVTASTSTGPSTRPTLPCPTPTGGWPESSSSLSEYQAFFATARAPADFAGIWGYEWGPVADPSKDVTVIAYTGDLDQHRAALTAQWSGPICLVHRARTWAELGGIRDQLATGTAARDLDIQPISATTDMIAGTVNLTVLTADDTTQKRLDDRFGPGTVKVTAAMQPLP